MQTYPSYFKCPATTQIRCPVNANKPFIVPVFIPHLGCPHRCVFCNQDAITGQKQSFPSAEDIRNQIKEFLPFGKNRTGTAQISFYGGNFLGLPKSHIQSFLSVASEFVMDGQVDSLRFSTRPDTITPASLDLLERFPVSTIEIGVQSMNDEVLRRSARGHTSQDTRGAVRLLKTGGYEIGLQMMVGLPGDNQNISLETGKEIADLDPDFVRIYPCVVLKHSPLEKLLRAGEFTPLSLDQAVDITTSLYILFIKEGIRVVRMGLQSSGDIVDAGAIVTGPFHPAFGHMVISRIFLGAIKKTLSNTAHERGNIRIEVHPKNISTARGIKNANIKAIENEYGIRNIIVSGDKSMCMDALRVQHHETKLPWVTGS